MFLLSPLFLARPTLPGLLFSSASAKIPKGFDVPRPQPPPNSHQPHSHAPTHLRTFRPCILLPIPSPPQGAAHPRSSRPLAALSRRLVRKCCDTAANS
ncbi:hypothetical protein QBC34DRAFT_415753 [Podospora aff. communis PSN243]|uniref:Secreted protein n=1 Tax=Podospora aff. communis PSN243 TaxID=3040156 RepID=A0AAV9G7R1_9PEZI|nr:hypothetical protein QBC34DRAFT_415753 [Podospora aff. communis PSN243]